MFQDCTLLGVHRGYLPSYSEQNGRPIRVDSNAGPRIEHIPLPSHFSPSRWMEGLDSCAMELEQGYQAITIYEESDVWECHPRGAVTSDSRGGSRYLASQKFPPSCY
jgi:hypothetical protein